jgi:hypothetical protein
MGPAGLLLLGVVGCGVETVSDSAMGDLIGHGTFEVELVPGFEGAGQAAILGRVRDGPSPANVIWELAGTEGDCELRTPRIPFCDPGCDVSEVCVEDDVCEPYPDVIEVGTVTVDGVQTTDGQTRFSMDPVGGYYQPAAAIDLVYPPFSEGDPVTFEAAGNETAAPFTMSVEGIGPIEVLSEAITLEDGQSVLVEWTPAMRPELAVIHVDINISYHGGTRGKLTCETADSGSLTLPGSLLDGLKELGVSGWPIIVFTRENTGTTEPELAVDLVIESSSTESLQIPGLISCNSDVDCPDGQECQFDFQCG